MNVCMYTMYVCIYVRVYARNHMIIRISFVIVLDRLPVLRTASKPMQN